MKQCDDKGMLISCLDCEINPRPSFPDNGFPRHAHPNCLSDKASFFFPLLLRVSAFATQETACEIAVPYTQGFDLNVGMNGAVLQAVRNEAKLCKSWVVFKHFWKRLLFINTYNRSYWKINGKYLLSIYYFLQFTTDTFMPLYCQSRVV